MKLNHMKTSSTTQSLIRLNWFVSLIICILEFGYLSFSTLSLKLLIVYTLNGFVVLLFIGGSNIIIRNATLFHSKEIRLNGLQLIISYISSLTINFLTWLIISQFVETQWTTPRALTMSIISVSIINTLIIILQNYVVVLHRKAQTEIENIKLKSSIDEATNLLLKQQIHPHFLFNALNTIKLLYKKDNKDGEVYLMHLANFLRASIAGNSTKLTTVKSELELCNDYMAMQKIRFDKALVFQIELSPQTINNGYVPVFSIQPLLENAIKHNDLTENTPLHITISERDGYIVVSNNIQIRKHKEISTGLGLLNLAERYRLYSGDEIEIKNDLTTFSVSIKILAHANSHH